MDYKNIELPRIEVAVFTSRKGAAEFAKEAVKGISEELDSSWLDCLEFVDSEKIDPRSSRDDIVPCICLIASGGVEHRVIDYTDSMERPVYILSMKGGNSLPASLEISSALRRQGRKHRIIHRLEKIRIFLRQLVTVIKAITILKGYKAAVIGGKAEWLVSDSPDLLGIQHFWGINIKELPLDVEAIEKLCEQKNSNFNKLVEQASDNNHFNSVFAQRFKEYIGSVKKAEKRYEVEDDYVNSLNVFLVLSRIIEEYSLSAVSLNCFKLVEKKMTACLALAALNDMGIPAACEGDSAAMISMAVSRAVTGSPGFMANVSDIDVDSGELWLTHCTVAPNMCERFDFNTHFESGLGLAVAGDFKFGVPVTLFRLGGPELKKHFIAGARVLGSLNEPLQCRTKARIMTEPEIARQMLEAPLGNHIIMIPGRHADTLNFLMDFKEMLHD
jgi:L-fucose isomerase-like protein